MVDVAIMSHIAGGSKIRALKLVFPAVVFSRVSEPS